MGTDISEGAKVGIILIILCALIAIVFSLLTMMKNITSSGSQSLQNGLDQLSDSEFQNYDQKTVSGTDVAAAIKIFEGRPVSFVVVTRADLGGGEIDSAGKTGHLYGANLAERANTAGTAGGSNAGDTYDCKVALSSAAESSHPTPAGNSFTGAGIVKYEGNAYYTGTLFTNNAGSVTYNMNVRPLSVTGMNTYVRPSAKFLAELIKDKTGTKIGVCFVQQN